MKTLAEVTKADLGQWVAGAAVWNPIEFNIAVVNKARECGFELDEEAWSNDVPTFLNGEATFDMVEDLGWVFEEALSWMNAQLPDWFYFDLDDGLVLFYDEPDAETA